MHTLEPYFNWRNLYVASEDKRSPFYGKEYSEFQYTNQIYNHLIHPQWDNIGSTTLFAKILFTDYDDGYCIMEFIGEWNDCLYNDVMLFHSSDDCYYEEWIDEIEDGWVCLLNAREHIIEEMSNIGIDQYFGMGGNFQDISWRTNRPSQLFQKIEENIRKRLTI